MHLRNTLAKGMDAESYSLHTFEALLSQSMEDLGNFILFKSFITMYRTLAGWVQIPPRQFINIYHYNTPMIKSQVSRSLSWHSSLFVFVVIVIYWNVRRPIDRRDYKKKTWEKVGGSNRFTIVLFGYL